MINESAVELTRGDSSDAGGSTTTSSDTFSSDDSLTETESEGDGKSSDGDPTYVPPSRRPAKRKKAVPTPRRKAVKTAPVAGPSHVANDAPTSTVTAPRQKVAKRKRCSPSPNSKADLNAPPRKRQMVIETETPAIPPLPPSFNWDAKVPPSKARIVHPDRPLCSHVFSDSQTASDVFFHLYKPAFDIWLQGTNENGLTLFGAKWKRVTYSEGLRFKAIRIFMNAVVLGNVEMYWSLNSNVQMTFVSEQMSMQRYCNIRRASKCCVPSENERTGASDRNSPEYDPLNKVTPMINALNIRFRSSRAPSDYLSLDEAMIKCQARCPFLVSMPKKPINYGLKLFVLAESDSAYIHSFILFHQNMRSTNDEEFGVTNALVFDMLTGVKFSDNVRFVNQGLTIVTDNYYGDVRLAYVLKLWDTHLVSTMRANRKHLPRNDLYTCKSNGTDVKIVTHGKSLAGRGYSALRHASCGEMTLAAWNDNKTVLVLSTDPTFTSQYGFVMRRNKQKRDRRHRIELPQPKIISLYSSKMSGVDLGDQRIASDHKHRRSRRWYMQMLDQGLEMTVLNTSVILRERPIGKRYWSAFRVKMEIVSGLRQMADRLDAPKVRSLPLRHHMIARKRLDTSLQHRPVKMDRLQCNRSTCVVHKQKCQPITKCYVCDVSLCVGECWRRFHFDVDYELFDDPLKRNKPKFRSVTKY